MFVHAVFLAAGDTELDLEQHVQDVLDLLIVEDLRRVVLVGHYYSGVVVGQVADRAPELVRRFVHLGSFLPRDGRSSRRLGRRRRGAGG